MNSTYPTAVLHDATPFAIAKSTRVTVRFNDVRSGLHQECKVQRWQGTIVKATLREYGGTRFRIRVDLNLRTVALLSPDYSWLPDPEDITIGVTQRIVQMLETRRSTHKLHVARRNEKLAD